MGLFRALIAWFGAPHPIPHNGLFDTDLTPEEVKTQAEAHLEDARRRLEVIKVQRDTQARRP